MAARELIWSVADSSTCATWSVVPRVGGSLLVCIACCVIVGSGPTAVPNLKEDAVRNMMTKKVIDAQIWKERVLSPRDTEEGSTTVEYAIGAVATAAFAGLLLAVLKSGGVKQMLNNIIQTALSM